MDKELIQVLLNKLDIDLKSIQMIRFI